MRALTHRLGSWRDAAGVYRDRRVLSLFFFGFASGLPLALTGATLDAWLTEAGMSLEAIGFAALVGLAYTLKFVWSPLVDRLALPLLTRRLGRRRGWMLLAQLALVGATVALGTTHPGDPGGLRWTILWAVVVAFASATQDIVIDAYRTEILARPTLGAGAATLTFGYRIAMLVSGGGALILAGWLGWVWAYAAMGAFGAVGIVAVLANPEPEAPDEPATAGDMAAWLRRAVVEPFRDFAARPAWPAILLFVVLFKTGDALLGKMATPFYLKIGFSLVEVGLVTKGYGLAMTLVGAALGGLLVARLGILRALLVTGILQAVSNLVFIVQAQVGHSVPMLAVTIGLENLSGGMGTTAFVAYLSSLCHLAYTATQYALLSSLMAVTRTGFAAASGMIAERTGWEVFFALTAVAALPGLLLLLHLMRRDAAEASDTMARHERGGNDHA